jgi:hypothetical protein
MLSQQGSVVFNYHVMPVAIRPIEESRKVFDYNTEYFFKPSTESTNGWEIMNDAETQLFKKTNFAVGYCGNEIALRTWSSKQKRELSNLNFMDGYSINDKREHLWMLVHTDWSPFEKCNREERKMLANTSDSYWQFRKLSGIAETSKTETVTLWYLSKHDLPTAELLKRFIEYLANK